MAQCSQQTKKKKACPVYADRLRWVGRERVWYCHVHDPEGVFREQVEANKWERIKARRLRQQHSSQRATPDTADESPYRPADEPAESRTSD